MNTKKLTPHEKYMMNQQQLETELVRLRKEWAVLDRMRLSGSFMKYANVMELFKKEHENILNDLMRAKDYGRIKEDSKIFDTLFLQIANYDRFDANNKQLKEHIQEIEDEIKKVNKSVHCLAKQQVTDRQHQDRVWAMMKTVEALENKLETQMIKFGTICTKNKIMRAEIDHLLWERRNFLQQWHSFITKLAEGKHIMLDLIEQATIAYNQREEWCTKLQALRIKAHQDLLANLQEMGDHIRKHDRNLKEEEFFLIKCQKRQMKALREKMRQKHLKREAELTEKLERYNNMLTDIKEFTKKSEIDDIAMKFIVQDEHNLSNFKYIINMLQEMEGIGDQLGAYHLEIEEKNILCNSRRHQQQRGIASLEDKLEHCIIDRHRATEKLSETENYLNSLLHGVWNLFKICKCNQDPLLKLLGDNNSVTLNNVHFYVDILESKIQEMLLIAHHEDNIALEKRKITQDKTVIKSEESEPLIHKIEKIVKTTPCSLCVEHEMVADVIDVLQQPVTREHAIMRLKRRLSLPGGTARLHNISNCQLPQSRNIMQKRYQ